MSSMKIKPEHYATVKLSIETLIKSFVETHGSQALDRYALRLKDSKAQVRDMQKRFRWDLLYTAVSSNWICDNLYSYMDDSHIDTALRSIVDELNLPAYESLSTVKTQEQ